MAWKMVEYLCPSHGRYEALENTSAAVIMEFRPTWDPCPICGVPGDPVISAPMVQQHSGSALYSIPKQSGPKEEPPLGAFRTGVSKDGRVTKEIVGGTRRKF